MIRLNSTTYDFKNARARQRHSVIVGDAKQTTFFPQAKIEFWNNEVNFSQRLINFGVGTQTLRADGQVVWNGTGVRCLFKEIGDDFDFITVLLIQPTSNRLIYSIQSKGLTFFKQLSIAGEVLPPGTTKQDRPVNVINSYAVFHASKRDNKYESGKAFHIFRPQAIDASGSKIWCNQNISLDGTKLVKIVPQSFLDTATYPVRII